MNWRQTWLLVGIAVALFAFIFLYERHITPEAPRAGAELLLSGFHAADVSELTLRKGSAVLITLEATNRGWRYTRPFAYPADALAVGDFLHALEQLVPATYISPQEINARKQTSADFGFDAPPIVLRLSGRERFELRFGARTPGNDQVYLQINEKPGIYVVAASILDRLPRTQHDWRDTSLFTVSQQKLDRVEVRKTAGSFALQRDPTNHLWRLTRPAHRADQLKVEAFVKQLEESRITSFVTDDPRADLDLFGLQSPVAEITIGGGTAAEGDKVLFGRSPTNDQAQVYARQQNATNIILLPRRILELVETNSFTDLRDRRLAAFAPDTVDIVEVHSGENTFTARRQASNTWMVADLPVDSAYINEWLAYMSQVRVREFVKDVVTDFSPYAFGRVQVTLRTAVTNGTTPTNAVVVQLDYGTNQTAETVFVRRLDEDSVYAVHLLDLLRTPRSAWQLRDHAVCRFASNQVALVVVSAGADSKQYLRQAKGSWASTTGEIPFALDEAMAALGQMNAVAWLGRGPAALEQFGFTDHSPRVEITLNEGEKTRVVTLRFGGGSPLRLPRGRVPYAATTIDGEPWVFEMPWSVFLDLQRELGLPAAP